MFNENSPNFIASRVYKDKYINDCNFVEEGQSENSSILKGFGFKWQK
jgi:hypothetical protein